MLKTNLFFIAIALVAHPVLSQASDGPVNVVVTCTSNSGYQTADEYATGLANYISKDIEPYVKKSYSYKNQNGPSVGANNTIAYNNNLFILSFDQEKIDHYILETQKKAKKIAEVANRAKSNAPLIIHDRDGIWIHQVNLYETFRTYRDFFSFISSNFDGGACQYLVPPSLAEFAPQQQ